MKFVQFLNEMPSMVDMPRDETESFMQKNKHEFKEGSKVGTFKGYDVINNGSGYSVLDKDGIPVLITFVDNYKRATELKDAVQQDSIWKDRAFKSRAIDFVYEFLLSKHKYVISGSSHSKGGRNLWETIIKDNINSSKYEVGYIKGFPKKVFQFDKDWKQTFDKSYDSQVVFYISKK